MPVPVRPRSALFRFRLRLAAIAALFVGGAALAACQRTSSEEPAAAASSEAMYVGDATCASCHTNVAATFQETGHARSFSRFDAASAPERFDGAVVRSDDGFVYDAFVRGDTLYQRERRYDDGPSAPPSHELVLPASYVIGSGRATRSYLMDVGGHLTEMPLTWYAQRKEWDLSPGYHTNNARFDRPITRSCFTCHNALPGFSEGTQNHYPDVPLGITCERCHGPASAHVAARQAGTAPPQGQPNPTLVSLATLDRGRQIAVCQQCHLEGTIVFKTGKTPASFRPGQRLSETRVVFHATTDVQDSTNFGLGSHAARLAQSACYKAATITCTTCHDPHQPVKTAGTDAVDNACRSCHAPSSLEAAVPASVKAEHVSTTGTCWTCHMQAAGTSDIPHVTFTDHWIRRRLPAVRAATETAVLRNTHVGPSVQLVRMIDQGDAPTEDPAYAALEEGLAFHEVWETMQKRPEHAARVRMLIRQAFAGGASSPDGYVALGRTLMDDSLATAEAVFRQGVEAYPTDARLVYWLGATLRRQSRAAEAIPSLQRALTLQPHFLDASVALGSAQQDAGQTAEAEASFRRVVTADPYRYPAAWNNLGLLLLLSGRSAEALDPLRRAVWLDPRLPEALVNLGGAELQAGDLAAADRAFRRALQFQPANTSALANRGLIAAQQGRRSDAIALFRQVVQLNPNDARARQMLDQLVQSR